MGLENGASKKHSDLIGQQFGRLTVVSNVTASGRCRLLCRCSCGNEKIVRLDHLKSGRIVSCGCYQSEIRGQSNKKHGMKNTRVYRCWCNMKTRCYNPSYIEFDRYGGRGISVCDEWQTFEPFYEWAMANGYRDGLTIDRIDNDGNYEPGNCKWSTQREQALNRRTNAMITHNEVTKHISEWDKEIGATKSGRVRARLNAGWSVADAVTVLVKGRR